MFPHWCQRSLPTTHEPPTERSKGSASSVPNEKGVCLHPCAGFVLRADTAVISEAIPQCRRTAKKCRVSGRPAGSGLIRRRFPSSIEHVAVSGFKPSCWLRPEEQGHGELERPPQTSRYRRARRRFFSSTGAGASAGATVEAQAKSCVRKLRLSHTARKSGNR